jgi:hypothetical protein
MSILTTIWNWLKKLWSWFRGQPTQAVGFRWTIDTGATVTLGENGMPLLLTDTQKVTLSIQPVDAKGFAAKVDGVPVWSVSDPTIGGIAIVDANTGLSAVFTALLPGVCQVNVTADADLGPGVTSISGTLDVQVEPGQAVSLSITAGAPVAQ